MIRVLLFLSQFLDCGHSVKCLKPVAVAGSLQKLFLMEAPSDAFLVHIGKERLPFLRAVSAASPTNSLHMLRRRIAEGEEAPGTPHAEDNAEGEDHPEAPEPQQQRVYPKTRKPRQQ